jgi:hypothetical protein
MLSNVFRDWRFDFVRLFDKEITKKLYSKAICSSSLLIITCTVYLNWDQVYVCDILTGKHVKL